MGSEAPKQQETGEIKSEEQKQNPDQTKKEYEAKLQTTRQKVEAALKDPNPAVKEAAKQAMAKLNALEPSTEQNEKVETKLNQINNILKLFESVYPAFSQKSQEVRAETETTLLTQLARLSDSNKLFQESHPGLDKNEVFSLNKLTGDAQVSLQTNIDKVVSVNTTIPAFNGDVESYTSAMNESLAKLSKTSEETDKVVQTVTYEHETKRDAVMADYASKQMEKSKSLVTTDRDLAQKTIETAMPESEARLQLLIRLNAEFDNTLKLLDSAMDTKARAIVIAEFQSAKNSMIREAKNQQMPESKVNVIEETAKRVGLERDAVAVNMLKQGALVSVDENLQSLPTDLKLRPGNVELRTMSGSVVTLLKPNQKVQVLETQVYEGRTGEKY
jgi:hypothetical protein